jgi:hypothetical protein
MAVLFTTMSIIDEVMSRSELQEEPPILFDVGASGGLNPAWSKLAKYAICVAFDPDDRDMVATRKDSSVYRELHVFNRALTSSAERASVFHLTSTPACSSLLRPNSKELANWAFATRFAVLKATAIQTIHASTVLGELHLDRIDWFKTDSQGTDLRLFLSLGESVIGRVLVAEFEPGIMDAYENEDKLWEVMRHMDELGFWMSDMTVKGSSRIRTDLLPAFREFEKTYMIHLHKISPGWAEVSYLNSMSASHFTKRDYLLAWVCASVRRQHGFALELACAGAQRFVDGIFSRLGECSSSKIRGGYFNLFAYPSLLFRALKRWKRLAAGRVLTQTNQN